MADLIVDRLTAHAGTLVLVDNASFDVRPGEMVAIIGPNGAGKSSLLRAILGQRPATSGTASIGGQSVAAMPPAQRARTISWLPQAVPLAWPINVSDAVALGRFAYGGTTFASGARDSAAVTRALDFAEVAHLSARNTAHLSGGELARVHLARAIASEAPWLLADEPVAALDPRHRIGIMHRLRVLADTGTGVLVVLHDLDYAARFCDRVIAMRGGAVIADGTPVDVITSPLIGALFDVRAIVDTLAGWPRVTITDDGTPPG